MSTYTEKRHHPRVTVRWPAVCFTPSRFGHALVMDVSPLAWRMQASMPVQVGMEMAVRIWPEESVYLEVQEARVLWVRDNEFAIEIFEVSPTHALKFIKLQEDTLGQPRKAPMDQDNLLQEVGAVSGPMT